MSRLNRVNSEFVFFFNDSFIEIILPSKVKLSHTGALFNHAKEFGEVQGIGCFLAIFIRAVNKISFGFFILNVLIWFALYILVLKIHIKHGVSFFQNKQPIGFAEINPIFNQ